MLLILIHLFRCMPNQFTTPKREFVFKHTEQAYRYMKHFWGILQQYRIQQKH